MIRRFLVRLGAILAKEFVQMRRDRVTFAMMLGIPVLLLILFGYAINTDPKRLYAALLATGQDHYSRAIVSALGVSGYYRFVARPKTDADAEGLIQSGNVAFLVIIPSDFGARRSGRQAADPGRGRRHGSGCGEQCDRRARRARDPRAPARAGAGARGRWDSGPRALDRRPQALQSRRDLAIFHRARSARRRPADDHGDDDLDRAHP